MNSNSPPILITVHRAVKYRDIVWNLRGNGKHTRQGVGKREEGNGQGGGRRQEGEAIN
jgi:hypothetical protein